MKIVRTHAVTLIEILLVTSLVAGVGLAIFQAFNNGTKIWSRAQSIDLQADVSILMDKIADDLRGVTLIGSIPFKGIGTQCSFPALVYLPTDNKSSRASEEMGTQIGAVEFLFDPAQGKIFRRLANYGQALKKRWGKEQVVASGVEEFMLRYYFKSGSGQEVHSIADDKMPCAVLVQVRLKGDSEFQWYKRYMPIPVAQ